MDEVPTRAPDFIVFLVQRFRQCAYTRTAQSAGLNFAVIALSKTMDVGRDHLIHRKRSPFPYEGRPLTRS